MKSIKKAAAISTMWIIVIWMIGIICNSTDAVWIQTCAVLSGLVLAVATMITMVIESEKD